MQFKLHNTRWSRTQKTQPIHNLKEYKIFYSKKILKTVTGQKKYFPLIAALLETMKQAVH